MVGHIFSLIFNCILVHLIFEMPPYKNQTFSHQHKQKVSIYLPSTTGVFSACLVELRKKPPNSLPELVNTVERYAASLNEDSIITAVNDILLRAQACIESDGGAFEYKLRSFKKRLNH